MPQTQTLALRHRPVGNILLRFARVLLRANARRAQRQCLSRLDPHLLRDIGLDPTTVAEECAKPFWRP